jgi:excisionase family DNA binding protein
VLRSRGWTPPSQPGSGGPVPWEEVASVAVEAVWADVEPMLRPLVAILDETGDNGGGSPPVAEHVRHDPPGLAPGTVKTASPWMSAEECAAMLNVTAHTLRRLAREERSPVVTRRIGGRWRFARLDVLRFVSQGVRPNVGYRGAAGWDGCPLGRGTVTRLLNPNPWAALPAEPPYVLPADRAAVDAWNAKAPPQTKIHTNLVPDPPLGKPLSAAVVVLALNPSLDDDTAAQHRDASLQQQMRAAMTDPRDLFWLRDELASTAGGRWWRNKLAPLIEATSLEAVREHVAAGHLHQYHSKSASPLLKPPSGRHNLEVVRKALDAGTPILVLTGVGRWRAADPAFRTAPLYEPRSPQSMVASPKNMPGGFEAAVRAIGAAAGN